MAKPRHKKFWEFRAADNGENIGALLLYGDIESSTWWGDEITPAQFKQDLDTLGEIAVLNVFINSGGGDVFAGQAIYSMLKRHQAQVNVYVDGLAASIASVVVMAGDTVYMPVNAMMMVHNPWTIALGNADDFRKMADDLDKIGESLIAAYQAKTGLEADEIKKIMDAETWMTAQDAIDLGFADEIEESKQVAASVNGSLLVVNGQKLDLSRFKNPPQLAFLPPESQEKLFHSAAPPIQRPPNEQGEPINQTEELSPEDEQTENGLLSLYQAQIKINQNRRMNRYES